MKNLIIFGDSYSTYENCVPDGHAVYYSKNGREEGPAVTKMELKDTWWQRVLAQTTYNLLRNDSWSGSTIGYTGYAGDCSHSSSFIYRFRQLKESGFFKANKVDTVFVFGGTNDSWANAPLGELQFGEWKEEDLFSVLPAVCHLAYALREELPNAEIYFIINIIKPTIMDGIKRAAEYYGATAIELHDIEKDCGHPTPNGMQAIAKQVLEKIKK